MKPPALPCRWPLHTAEGPVRVMTHQLLSKRLSNVARLMALTSLQLTKLLTQNPALLPLYKDAYKQMLLQGISLGENPETTLEVEVETSST